MKRLTTHPRRQARRERAALRAAAATLANLLGNGPVTRAGARGYTHIPRSEWPAGKATRYRRAAALVERELGYADKESA